MFVHHSDSQYVFSIATASTKMGEAVLLGKLHRPKRSN